MNRVRTLSQIDWKKHKAVIIQSDDWGFCGWSPNIKIFEKLRNIFVKISK